MKSFFTIAIIILFSFNSFSQELSEKQLSKFKNGEIALLEYMNMFAYDTIPFETRVKNIHDFIPRFVGLLKEKNSFLYPFDSLRYISKITSPDNSFKIFTWELVEPLGTHRYYGAIQFNSKNLQIIPLFDYSDTMEYHTQKTLTPSNWYGCIYYNCELTIDENGKKYYNLFGLDRGDFISNIKILDIMTFDDQTNVEFGAKPLIYFYTLDVLYKKETRLFLEYYDKSVVHLNYNKVKEEIVYDHVTPPNEKQKDAKFSYIPDGTYEGLKWNKNFWKSIYRVFKYSIGKPDSPPMPAPQNNSRKKDMFGN